MSFTTSLNGIANAQTELNVTANNLANAQTTGFKSSRVNFADLVAGSAYTNPKLIEGVGSRVKSIDQNYSNGSIETTGSATDLAVNGQGFFTVKVPSSGTTLYTRNGNFALDGSGYLTDASGNRVQGFTVNAAGAATTTTPTDIQIPTTDAGGGTFSDIQVNSTGIVTASYSDGTTTPVFQVALATFVSPDGLRQLGTQNWQATGLSGAATYSAASTNGDGTILSGSLEESNVDVSSELVNLIQAQQYFQSNSKAISTNDQMVTSILQVQ